MSNSKNLIQDFSSLPRLNSSNAINWEKSVGHVVNYSLDDKNGQYMIVDWKMKNKKSLITIRHNGLEYTAFANTIHNGAIKTFLRGHRKIRQEYNIGDIINLGSSTFTVIGVSIRCYKTNDKKKFIPYYCLECHKCHGRYWKSIKEFHYGCSICSGAIVQRGINDLAMTDSFMEKYFSDEDKWLMFTITRGSGRKINPICPFCGVQSSKKYKITQLRHTGFSCSCNSDGISYPEKFIGNILSQIGVNYITQATTCDLGFDVDHKKYDFYLPYNKCIIETHGIQHYIESKQIMNWRTYEEEIKNDAYKEYMAVNNGIQNYIVLDCRISEAFYIKESLLSSPIFDLLNVSQDDIDWIKADQYATKNIIKTICEDFMDNPFEYKELLSKYHISKNTLDDYIKKGSKFDWVNYEIYRLMSGINILNKMITPENEIFYFKNKQEIRKYFITRNIPYNMERINDVFDKDIPYQNYYFYTINNKEDVLNILNRDEDKYFIKANETK